MLCLGLTFAMITLGGVVHNTGSSLACPDWPLCFGQVFPTMVGEVAIEHSHRLLGTVIGFVCIAMVYYAVKIRKQNSTPLKMTSWLLALVIFQGILGGVTVLLKLSPIVSTAHLATSQIFVASTWLFWAQVRLIAKGQNSSATTKPAVAPAFFDKLSLSLMALVFVTMCWGAFIRHGGSAVACGLGAQSILGCVDGSQGPEALLWPNFLQAQVHMLHRYLAFLTALFVYFGTLPILKWAKANGARALKLNVIVLHALVTVQIVLGFLTVYTMISNLIVTLHLIFGMCLWLASLQLRIGLWQFSSKTQELQRAN